MKSAWVERDAKALVAESAESGVGRDLALRVYTTRLLGRDRKLVMHGGGNTSLKERTRDSFGEDVEILRVKATGLDMARIGLDGFSAVRLGAVRKLRALDAIDDAKLLGIERANLIDPTAPNPSLEMMLHAFLPQKFVDHTHATAVLSVTDQADGEEKCGEVFGRQLGFVPYVMPGFGLAKQAIKIYERDKPSVGLILGKHGIVTFGEHAREAYERMIEMVSLAEEFVTRNRKSIAVSPPVSRNTVALAKIAPVVRGACCGKDQNIEGAWRRLVMEFRATEAIMKFLANDELKRFGKAGVITPDHVIRTKSWPLVLPPPRTDELDEFARAARKAAAQFTERYHCYFERHSARSGGNRRELDPLPRVVLVPGLGLFGLGRTKQDAVIAADIAEAWVEGVSGAEAIGRFQSISEGDMFDCEYWPLEQAKLRAATELPLTAQIAVVTGAAGAIGAATAHAFAAAGAEVALLDLDVAAARATANIIGANALALKCDVTNAASVNAAFAAVVENFGGVDIAISNAGAAWQGRIGEIEEDTLRKSFELNFYGHQRVAQAATKVMLAQGTGGCLLFNASKQAVNPGADFGPYGVPKAALLALMRQYALDYGSHAIRANAVNADRIRSGLLTPAMIAARAKARGVSEKEYMRGNLLQREVTAEDVAQAFLHLALALKTTAAVATVDGGNIAAAMR